MSDTPSTETKTPKPNNDSTVVAKLKKHKAAKGGSDTFVLPQTGLTVTWPSFKPHHIWMKAQRVSKKNPASVMDVYLTLLCKFDGENLTLLEFKELLPTDDVLDLTSEVMGDDDDDEDVGNALH